MTIETRLTNLENFVFSFIKSQQDKDEYINDDIQGTRQNITEKVDSVSTNITSNYDASKTYTLNEYVNYNGNLYRFIKERGSAIEPTNTLYWTLCDIATELNRIISLIK